MSIYVDESDCYFQMKKENVVKIASTKTLSPKKKDAIVKEAYMEAAQDTADYLELGEEEEDEKIMEWICGLCISLEELHNQTAMAGMYEAHRIGQLPEDELPLLIGNLKTDEGREKLLERMKA